VKVVVKGPSTVRGFGTREDSGVAVVVKGSGVAWKETDVVMTQRCSRHRLKPTLKSVKEFAMLPTRHA